MKKIASVMVFLAMPANLVLGARVLKLDTPNGGETWTLGQKYPIQWTAIQVAQKVKLVLILGGTVVGIIGKGLDAGSSPFTWTAGLHEGGMAAPDTRYKVRIRTMDNELGDASDRPFALSGPSGGEKPDFEVSHMGCMPRVRDGAVYRVDVQLYVKNNGTDYQGPLSVHFICLDSLTHTQIAIDQVLTLPGISIPHGQWYGFPLCQIPWPSGVTSVHFGIQLDPDSLVVESNETNNHFNYSYTLPPLDEIPQR